MDQQKLYCLLYGLRCKFMCCDCLWHRKQTEGHLFDPPFDSAISTFRLEVPVKTVERVCFVLYSCSVRLLLEEVYKLAFPSGHAKTLQC